MLAIPTSLGVIRYTQGWEFPHLLIATSLIHSFAQVAHVKRATISDLLTVLMINEQMSESLIPSFAYKKQAIRSKKLDENHIVGMLFVSFF